MTEESFDRCIVNSLTANYLRQIVIFVKICPISSWTSSTSVDNHKWSLWLCTDWKHLFATGCAFCKLHSFTVHL